MIVEKNLLDAIGHCEEVARKNYTDGCIECAKEHEQLAEWLKELLERRKVSEWIPVEEHLPEEGQMVLITLKHNMRKYIKKSRYSNETFWNADARWVLFKDDAILAWMPLPEPYKQE